MIDTELRRLRDDEADYLLLEKWCRTESVYRYFEQRILSPDEIRRKYRPRTSEQASVPVYMIEHKGVPVGIIQYQRISPDSECRRFVLAETAFELDIFIGEADRRGKGAGPAAVNLLAEKLFEEMSADALVMCPLTENVRAIGCYLKCGFEEKGRYTAPDTVGVQQEYTCMTRFSNRRST